MRSPDSLPVTWGELRMVLRYLERKAHPQSPGAASLGSRQLEAQEATRTLIWEERQGPDGAFLVSYGDAYV